MGKRDLKKYLDKLEKDQVSEQLLELYDKFPEVKTYYDFIFNPNEEKLTAAAKAKISNEYFPVKTKRAKLRRSTAQKYIKHFISLGVDPFAIADVMLFNIEVAQRYTAKREMRYSSFYKSMSNSFLQAVEFIVTNGITSEFLKRLESIHDEAQKQKWDNRYDFEIAIDRIKE